MDAASSPAFPMISEPRSVVRPGATQCAATIPHRNNRLRSSIKSLTQAWPRCTRAETISACHRRGNTPAVRVYAIPNFHRVLTCHWRNGEMPRNEGGVPHVSPICFQPTICAPNLTGNSDRFTTGSRVHTFARPLLLSNQLHHDLYAVRVTAFRVIRFAITLHARS